LSPVEAVVAKEGTGIAPIFGWMDPPGCTGLMPLHDEADATTDRLCAAVYDRALSGQERAEFAAIVGRIGAAVLPQRA